MEPSPPLPPVFLRIKSTYMYSYCQFYGKRPRSEPPPPPRKKNAFDPQPLGKILIRYMRCTSYNILTMLWNINMINKSPTIIFLAICGFLRFRIFRCKEILYHIFSSGMYRKHDKPNVLKICEYGQLYLPPNPQVFGVLGFPLFCILQKE